jgi:hypothetical protein
MDTIRFVIKSTDDEKVKLDDYAFINDVKLSLNIIIDHISETLYDALERDLTLKISMIDDEIFNVDVLGINVHPAIAYEFFNFEFI